MSETRTGVIDRIVDGETAVILIEEDGETVDQFDIDAEGLPEGAGEGAVLNVEIAGSEVRNLEYLREETNERKQAAQDRLDSLSKLLSEK